jgi:nucleoredoxin
MKNGNKRQAVEIIFISSDQSEDQYNEYYESMPWKRMKFTESEKKQLLSAFFEIRGIPSLVFVSEEHGLITKDGRSAAFEVKQISDIVQFEEEKRIKEAKLAAEIETLPMIVTIDQHPHPLHKLSNVYGGQYGCDVCSKGGSGWVYHCDECRWDAHPYCAVIKQETEST